MPVIIRCSVCNKPIGTVDTPCVCSNRYVQSGGDMTVCGDLTLAKDGVFASCPGKCSDSVLSDHPTPKLYNGFRMVCSGEF